MRRLIASMAVIAFCSEVSGAQDRPKSLTQWIAGAGPNGFADGAAYVVGIERRKQDSRFTLRFNTEYGHLNRRRALRGFDPAVDSGGTHSQWTNSSYTAQVLGIFALTTGRLQPYVAGGVGVATATGMFHQPGRSDPAQPAVTRAYTHVLPMMTFGPGLSLRLSRLTLFSEYRVNVGVGNASSRLAIHAQSPLMIGFKF